MIERLNLQFKADIRKVVLLPFTISNYRIKKVIQRVNSLSEKEVSTSLKDIYSKFSMRHKYFEKRLLNNYSSIEKFIADSSVLSRKRKLLLGANFSREYSIEASSLFNPSIVEHPNQDGIPKGSKRLVMSLRATGEGHVSSIEFRELVIDKNCKLKLNNTSRFSVLPEIQNFPINLILEKRGLSSAYANEIRYLIEHNYKCSFPKETSVSERVIFPHSKSEMAGMEDVRLVKFIDKGKISYYGTYTVYNGKTFRVQLITTRDFTNFDIETINGPAIHDKGLALFPEKIDDNYSMIGRIDGENLYLLQSKNLYSWSRAELIRQPKNKWEFIQIGNCGSPLKTDAGWILITHAVGPLRRYVISALLLDLKNPSKIIGSLEDPLIEPNKNEREGYVPNVVYSCGSIIHNNQIIIPYAMADSYCGFARIKVEELLGKFK
jgi:predicted GH43/DUF377 family glycosyl hydrolase